MPHRSPAPVALGARPPRGITPAPRRARPGQRRHSATARQRTTPHARPAAAAPPTTTRSLPSLPLPSRAGTTCARHPHTPPIAGPRSPWRQAPVPASSSRSPACRSPRSVARAELRLPTVPHRARRSRSGALPHLPAVDRAGRRSVGAGQRARVESLGARDRTQATACVCAAAVPSDRGEHTEQIPNLKREEMPASTARGQAPSCASPSAYLTGDHCRSRQRNANSTFTVWLTPLTHPTAVPFLAREPRRHRRHPRTRESSCPRPAKPHAPALRWEAHSPSRSPGASINRFSGRSSTASSRGSTSSTTP